MKITLILASSPNDPLRKNDPFMPLSLPLLAASAPEHEYTFINMLSGDKINYKKPVDLVGISARITAEKTAYKIAEKFKKQNVCVVLGGPQISSVPYKAINYADAVVVGEGELLWPVVLKNFQENNLKNFYVCSPKKFDAHDYSIFQINSYVDLKNIPIPSRHLFKRKYTFDTIFASRGCPIDCDFCSVSSLFGKKIRTRPVTDVVKEIDTFKNYYYMLDDTVFGRPSNYDYYIRLYEDIARLRKKRYWTGQANLDAASTKKGREVIAKAAKSGLVYAAIGMESINPIIQQKSGVIKKMGVKSSENVISSMKENIKFIQDQGIIISGWFTIGYDEDNIDTFYKTLEFCKETNIIPVISPLEALPGTRLYSKLKSENKINNKKRINIIHPSMNDEEIIKAFINVTKKGYSLKETIKRTIFYSKKFEKYNCIISSKIYNKIHKTMFAVILQLKVKKGIIGFANNEVFIKK